MNILSHLEPHSVFYYFEEICAIPHGSGNTKAISDYCVTFAREHGLRHRQDSANNVIIWKPGSSGCENASPVLLQGHLDMVCEKEEGCTIDFLHDGLSLQVNDGIISARGTTLGGDDGIAVAYALAILASKDIPHPPLEVVLTTDEEIGMLGATALDCKDLQSRIMLNIDSEEEGSLLVSCAGGVTATAEIDIPREQANGMSVTLAVTGLLGGHSGIEIHRGRANACQLLGRSLYSLGQSLDFGIVSIQGGLKDNAIPREATAKLLVSPETAQQLKTEAARLTEIYKKEYAQTDPGVMLSVTLSENNTSEEVMVTESASRVVAALINLPGGVQRMSADIEGLVQTSLNLGILKTTPTKVSYSLSLRSSVETEKQELTARIQCLMDILGGSMTCHGDYPAWEYRKDSPLRELMETIFEKLYGKKPVVEAVHAGVECGIFAGKLPGLDCVSFGPDMKNIHTPNESMDAESVKRTWDYLLEILKHLAGATQE